ncbi:hypothetical protein SBW85_19680 [Vibrio plantisponsor]|uniref:Uncharacterized protein n=1 Tax=Vibrio plantisponsor TaxID=664643 RepID=A0ABU4INQ6_9VIBR|nr:hypothetical protein [Vibrio plantisponsor]MDW6019929.1 hypothetical protein [Vibrio plantisponsor]NNM38742.1 hypothetical protein [Vibrio plantisponsor]
MDTSSIIIDYSEADFADSLRALLPKGEYWQEAENVELTNVIEALAIDFKTTHDDVQLSLLTDFKQALFGWKISEFQALLYEVAGNHSGVVSDSKATPNLIYVLLGDEYRGSSKKAWTEFEKKRLPHTEITWTYQSRLHVHHQLANCRHIRNLHTYEVTQ